MNNLTDLLNSSKSKHNLQLNQAYIFFCVNKVLTEVLSEYDELSEFLPTLKIAINQNKKQELAITQDTSNLGLVDKFNLELKQSGNPVIEIILSTSNNTFRTFLKLNATDIKERLGSQENFENIEFVFIFR